MGLAQYAVLCLQSDASTERLLQRVVSPEEGLAAYLLWREEEERIAVEQAAMWMAQPPRRNSAASTKSWLRMWPPNGLRPPSSGSPACSAKAAVRIIALWPH